MTTIKDYIQAGLGAGVFFGLCYVVSTAVPSVRAPLLLVGALGAVYVAWNEVEE